ncbi:MAG: pyridoxal-dependent decarboxylase [Acidimicrobiia bacterium]|nr:pyridoxal-dependent decarboxylase [Acidimicrobiia bacterium]
MRAETGAFSEYLTRIGRALDQHLEGERSDPVTTIEEWKPRFTGSLPERGVGAAAVVAELESGLIPNGPRMSESGFWGFITTGPTTIPAVAQAAALVAAPQRYTINAFNLLEELSLDWLGDLCGLSSGMKGLYSSGGSTANLVALGAARQWAFEQIGVDPSARAFGDRATAIYASTEVHHTVQRSAGVLGLGRAAVRVIPTDDRQRMEVGALQASLKRDRSEGVLPVAVVGTCGTTNTGAIDPLRPIGELAAELGVWFHVDGAYGLPGILDERIAARFDGLGLADSVIVDPHKWLAAPVGVAATFVRDRTILHRAFTQEPAEYLEGSFAEDGDVEVSMDSLGVPFGDFGVELSSPSRGVIVWSILLEQGREGVRERIRRDNDFARHVADRATRHPRLESLTEPELSIACIRYSIQGVDDLNELNARLLRRLVRTTPFLPSATVVHGAFAIRPCFINPRTTWADVDGFVDAVVAIGDELTDR